MNLNTRAQLEASCIPASHSVTRRTRKRTIECVIPHSCDADKENASSNGHSSLTPAIVTGKRICREQTGTDWQTVLDIIKYGEERSKQKNVATMEEK